MCGIVGYVGPRSPEEIKTVILEGLKLLEPRGYDSAGVAFDSEGGIQVVKAVGTLSNLVSAARHTLFKGPVAIGHTRWATHGVVNLSNAHPHQSGDTVIVHNGVVENERNVRRRILERGYECVSETDSELIAHLIEDAYDGNLLASVRRALLGLQGAYGLLVMHANHPGELIAVGFGSPMVIGIGDREKFAASEPRAFAPYTDRFIRLKGGQIANLKAGEFSIETLKGEPVPGLIQVSEKFESEPVLDQRYPHHMLQEICEQPETVERACRGRMTVESGLVHLGGLEEVKERLFSADKLVMVACGTSHHAALFGQYVLETLTRLPIEVVLASEMSFRNVVITPYTAVLGISQSGETKDTFEALSDAGKRGALLLGMVNQVETAIDDLTKAGVHIRAGWEVAVASTKAFTSQCAILPLIALLIGRHQGLPAAEAVRILSALKELPDQIQRVLDQKDKVHEVARFCAGFKNALFLGRGPAYPIAMEGALKLKEISYIHAEGYAAGEMKHGAIALIDPNLLTVAIVLRDTAYEKMMVNLREIQSRKGKIVAVATEGDREVVSIADHVVYTPATIEILQPILAAVVLQLIAYYTALELGCPIDKPRNLAKTVAVE